VVCPGTSAISAISSPSKPSLFAEQDRDRLLSKMVATAEIVAKAGDDWTKSDPEFASLLDLPRFQLGNHVTTLGSALSRVFGVLFWQYTRLLYQCAACGRLWVQDHYGMMRPFLPEEADVPAVLLDSMESDHAHKTTLRGIWRDGRGVLGWTRAWSIPAHDEEADDWEDLERRFHLRRADFARGNQLDEAMLERDGAIVYLWRPEP